MCLCVYVCMYIYIYIYIYIVSKYKIKYINTNRYYKITTGLQVVIYNGVLVHPIIVLYIILDKGHRARELFL